jgi:tight adherence protein B
MGMLVFLFTFLVVGGLVFGIWVFAGGDPTQESIRKRMTAVHRAERRGDVSQILSLVRDEMLSDVPWIHRFLLQWSWATKLQDFIAQAGLKMKPGKILLLGIALGLAAYIVAAFLTHFPLAAVLLGLFAATTPVLFIAWKRRQRLRQFEERFPEALDLLGRAVRAGHAFTTGVEMIAKDSAEPIAGEFRITFEEQNFGLPLRDALLNLSERVPLVDVRFFVTALLIQKETGGNLAEILDGLAHVIRDRFRIYRDVQVKTAQGKLTAGILIAMPIIMVFALNALNHEYMKVLFEDPRGPYILTVAAVMQLIGSMLLWKIIHFEV